MYTVENKVLVGAPQGYGMMNAIKTAERKLENGTLVHAPSALTDWCVGNVKIEPTATAIRATKQNAGDAKIDPWAALTNAVWMMSRNPEAAARSGWNTDDIDGLMARIDAAVEAMTEMGDPAGGRQALHGVGRPCVRRLRPPRAARRMLLSTASAFPAPARSPMALG
jgi:phage terminase large subunit-like protein